MTQAGRGIHTEPYVRVFFGRTENPRQQGRLNQIIQGELKDCAPKRYLLRKIEPHNTLQMDVPALHYTRWVIEWNPKNLDYLKFESQEATK